MHVIEAALQQSIPRPVRRKPLLASGASRLSIGCLGLFVSPFVIVGLAALLYALSLSFTLAFGSTTPGTVLSQQVISDSESGDTYRVTYRYKVNSVEWTGRDNVEPQQFAALVAETPVTVKYFPLIPGTNSVLDGATTAPGKVRFLWLWITVWDGALVGAAVGIRRALQFQRRLVQYGRATTARIQEKACESDTDNTRYLVHYVFRTESGLELRDKRVVGKEEWDSVQEGETVTVLYLPDRPAKHDIYRFCAYEATRH